MKAKARQRPQSILNATKYVRGQRSNVRSPLQGQTPTYPYKFKHLSLQQNHHPAWPHLRHSWAAWTQVSGIVLDALGFWRHMAQDLQDIPTPPEQWPKVKGTPHGISAGIRHQCLGNRTQLLHISFTTDLFYSQEKETGSLLIQWLYLLYHHWLQKGPVETGSKICTVEYSNNMHSLQLNQREM